MAKVFKLLVYGQVSKFVDQHSILHIVPILVLDHTTQHKMFFCSQLMIGGRDWSIMKLLAPCLWILAKAFGTIPLSLLLEKLCQ